MLTLLLMKNAILIWTTEKSSVMYHASELFFTHENLQYLYPPRSGSDRNSRNNIPSVMYFIMVLSDVQSSNLILYPTYQNNYNLLQQDNVVLLLLLLWNLSKPPQDQLFFFSELTGVRFIQIKLKLWVRTLFMAKCIRYTTLCDKFVGDLWQVVGFHLVLRFPPPIKLTATI